MKDSNWSPTGWQAFYGFSDTNEAQTLPIERWDSISGKALVVSEEHQCLVSAEDLPGFQRIDVCHRPVGFVAAAADTVDKHSRPVVAWMIDEDGLAYPVTHNG